MRRTTREVSRRNRTGRPGSWLGQLFPPWSAHKNVWWRRSRCYPNNAGIIESSSLSHICVSRDSEGLLTLFAQPKRSSSLLYIHRTQDGEGVFHFLLWMKAI